VRRLAVVGAVAIAGLVLSGQARAAPWCGTPSAVDRPAAVAGNQISVLYAVPSDGVDASVTTAPQISADVDAVDEWWRAQDPVRAPRFDRALFTCGPQADVRVIRLSRTGDELRPEGSRFALIAAAVAVATANSPYLKHLVYYDGPLDGDEICGQGGGLFDGPGVAIVYTRACSGEPTAVVAAHELLHAMGALPAPGPPHACVDEDASHVCDSASDILWPYATLTPLAAMLLDVGRDDYYGHGGGWPDVRDSAWLQRLDAQTPLALDLRGRGRVGSDVPGVDCAGSCGSLWDTGTQVLLTAVPASDQVFVRWSGACAGRLPTCALAIGEPTSVGALFGPPAFVVRISTSGRGTVKSVPAGVACPGRCTGRLPSYAPVRLVARPGPGWRFKAWSGACRGRSPGCRLTLDGPVAARATFVRVTRP
jgi:hypothetical protein